jgi:hypothetical protein
MVRTNAGQVVQGGDSDEKLAVVWGRIAMRFWPQHASLEA